MTINLEPMMLHMAWANQHIFKEIAKLPAEALNAYVTNPEWHVAEILQHIVKSADNYGCRIAGGKYFEFEQPKTMREILVMADNLKKHDARLLEYTYARTVVKPRFRLPITFTSFKRTKLADLVVIKLIKSLHGKRRVK